MSSYKTLKEAFVSDASGSTITHINLISLAALLSVSLYSLLKTRSKTFQNVVDASSLADLLLQWGLLVLPLLFSMTVSAKQPIYLNVALLVPILALLRIPLSSRGIVLPMASSLPPMRPGKQERPASFAPLPALTTYRSHMMLMTVLGILAVDFPVFPRELAKCETFGVSLMDLGVGSFVFSQGVVSAIPILKNPSYLASPSLPKLRAVTRKSIPIIVLGLIRVLLVKGTEYPEHVTEYGVHWNFFITLALLPILQVVLHPLLRHISISAVGVLLGVAQQIVLSTSLQSYILDVPRSTSLVSKNKEGFASLLGYLSIHILGLSAGILVLPPIPGFFRRSQKLLTAVGSISNRPSDLPLLAAPRQIDKTATELCAYSILWWTAVAVAGSLVESGAISRRLVNLRYILWIAAFNTSFLLSYIVVIDMWIYKPKPVDPEGDAHGQTNLDADDHLADASSTGRAEKVEKAGIEREKLRLKEQESVRRRVKEKQREALESNLGQDAGPKGGIPHGRAATPSGNPPRLFEMVNRHGLVFFLGANLLTGLLNLTVQTMYVSDANAMVLLSGYSFVLCGTIWLYERYSLR